MITKTAHEGIYPPVDAPFARRIPLSAAFDGVTSEA